MMGIKYNLFDFVEIECTGDVGQVFARTDYPTYSSYYIVYKNSAGAGVKEWWDEFQLKNGRRL